MQIKTGLTTFVYSFALASLFAIFTAKRDLLAYPPLGISGSKNSQQKHYAVLTRQPGHPLYTPGTGQKDCINGFTRTQAARNPSRTVFFAGRLPT